jgi:hypothetical protein
MGPFGDAHLRASEGPTCGLGQLLEKLIPCICDHGSGCRLASLAGCAGSFPVSCMLPFEPGAPVATPEGTSKWSPVMGADLQDW